MSLNYSYPDRNAERVFNQLFELTTDRTTLASQAGALPTKCNILRSTDFGSVDMCFTDSSLYIVAIEIKQPRKWYDSALNHYFHLFLDRQYRQLSAILIQLKN